MKKNVTLKLVTTSSMIALAIILARVSHMLGGFAVASLLSPMHLPIMLVGLLCGWQYALFAGIATPAISFMISGSPPFPFVLVPMIVELSLYGLISAVVNGVLIKKNKLFVSNIVALIVAIVVGRLGNTLTSSALLFIINGMPFWVTLVAELASIFVSTWLAIVLQLTIIPLVMQSLKKSNLLFNYLEMPVTEENSAPCSD